MLQDDRLSSLAVDNAFAYHNLPGYPLGEILVKQGTYACASTGVVINFTGKTSHAARPENGVSPVGSVIETIQYLESLPEHYPDSFGLVTIVHVQVGDAAFGVAPGEAKVMATMRSDNNDTFERMKRDICKKLTLLKQSSGIEISLSWDEPFSAAVNSSQHVRVIEQQANSLGLNVQTLPEPMRWSEDFAEFLKKWPGALFCIGSGESHPELHNPDYDFPDEIIETAATLFMAVVNRLHHG
jgi:metal-dependent amidase/aminoacylase/carboxypeptidase family protein